MINAYDILLNFSDEYLYDFFEWKESDMIDNVRKTLIFRVNNNVFYDFKKNLVKISDEFLSKIKNKTIVDTNTGTEQIEYACILSNTNDAFAIMFSSGGESVMKSNLLPDELEEICQLAFKVKTSSVKYNKIEKELDELFLTRNEREKRGYLLREFNRIKEERDVDKLRYIYYEWYGKNENEFNVMFNKLFGNLSNLWTDNHDKLFNIIKLIHIKK